MLFNMGGGSPVNYILIGSAQAPAEPGENTLWVSTSVPVTDHVFAVDRPQGQEGRVWIATSNYSTMAFSILLDNTVMVYPTAAYQYTSGAWTAVPLALWRDGDWSEPSTYLFRNGDQCTDITGGWTNVTAGADTLNVTAENDGAVSVSTGTVTAVDMTVYHRLSLQLDAYLQSFVLRLTNTSGDAVMTAAAESTGVMTVDVSGLEGAHKLELIASGDGYAALTVSSVWLS